jgi:hypothetical protein
MHTLGNRLLFNFSYEDEYNKNCINMSVWYITSNICWVNDDKKLIGRVITYDTNYVIIQTVIYSNSNIS